MRDNNELCKWLRDNSSGSYRKSADAADVIENLDDELERKDKLIEDIKIACHKAERHEYPYDGLSGDIRIILHESEDNNE